MAGVPEDDFADEPLVGEAFDGESADFEEDSADDFSEDFSDDFSDDFSELPLAGEPEPASAVPDAGRLSLR